MHIPHGAHDQGPFTLYERLADSVHYRSYPTAEPEVAAALRQNIPTGSPALPGSIG